MQRGQVVKLDRGYPLVRTDEGSFVRCEHATALVKGEEVRAVIGDFVEVTVPEGHDKGIIESILPRTRAFVRKDPTERALPQVLAANFDRVFVAQPLSDVNVRRLERELVLAYETGAAVTVVLTKADLAESDAEVASVRDRVRALAGPDVQTVVVSADDPSSVEAVRALVPPNTTAVLIGKSGVGKSSLINMLVGHELQETTPVRDRDGKGRHTTVSREMVAIPGGGFIMDMPGVRGLGLWEADAGIGRALPIPRLQPRGRAGMRRARRRRVGRYQRTALRIVPGASPGDERPARAPRRGSPHARRKSLRPGKNAQKGQAAQEALRFSLFEQRDHNSQMSDANACVSPGR